MRFANWNRKSEMHLLKGFKSNPIRNPFLLKIYWPPLKTIAIACAADLQDKRKAFKAQCRGVRNVESLISRLKPNFTYSNNSSPFYCPMKIPLNYLWPEVANWSINQAVNKLIINLKERTSFLNSITIQRKHVHDGRTFLGDSIL